jgi:hypothetical protein
VDSFYTGSGLKLIEKDAAKTLVISNDYGSQKTTDLVAKLGEWLSRSDAWTAGTDVSEQERLDNPTPFNEGRALFLPIRAQHIENTTMRENFKPGILPVPKYDTTQSEYYTAIGNAFTLYGITKSSLQRTEMGRTEASKMMTAVLECWGSEGYRRTTPQIYDNNFTGKLVENDTEAQMFDIIRSGIVIDLGRILGYELVVTSGQYPMSELPSQSICNYEAWSVNYNRYYSGMSDKLAELVGAIVWG